MRTSLKDEVASYLGCYLLFELKRIIFVNIIDNIFQIALFYWLTGSVKFSFCHVHLVISVKFYHIVIIMLVVPNRSEVPLVHKKVFQSNQNLRPQNVFPNFLFVSFS